MPDNIQIPEDEKADHDFIKKETSSVGVCCLKCDFTYRLIVVF